MSNCTMRKTLLAGMFLLSIPVGGAIASDAEPEENSLYHQEHGHHSLGVFLGVTREHGENRETLGVEYSYRFHHNWSAGVVVERAERDQDSTLAVAFVHFWPTEFLYLGFGVGRKDPGDEREVTYRGTIGYEFELGKSWSLSPQANIDWIENEDNEEVYGLVFARRF